MQTTKQKAITDLAVILTLVFHGLIHQTLIDLHQQ